MITEALGPLGAFPIGRGPAQAQHPPPHAWAAQVCHHAPSPGVGLRGQPSGAGGRPLSDLEARLPGGALAAWGGPGAVLEQARGEQNRVLGIQAPLSAFLMATGAGRCRATRRDRRRGRLAGSPALPGSAHARPSLQAGTFTCAHLLSVSLTAPCARTLTTDY